MPTLNLAIDATGAKQGAAEFAQALKRAQGAAEAAGVAVRGIERNTATMSKTMTGAIAGLRRLVAGFAAVAAARKAFTVISDFSTGLIGVGKTADLAGKALDSMGLQIIEMSKRIPVATNELLEIAQAAGQLGVKGEKDILAFTETVARLGRASDLAGAEAATALARILNVTGEAATNVNVLGSVIVELGNNSAATEREIALMTTQIAQSTGRFGVSSTAAAGMSAALASLGIQSELAGSTLGRAFIGIEAAIQGGGRAFRELEELTGIAGAELKRQFSENADVVFERFIKGVGRATAEGRTLSDVLREFDVQGTRDIRVFGALSERADLFSKSLALAKAEQKDVNALLDESNKAFSTLAGAVQQVKNDFSAALKEFANSRENLATIKGLIEDIGAVAVPAFETLVGLFARWAEGVRNLRQDLIALSRTLKEGAAPPPEGGSRAGGIVGLGGLSGLGAAERRRLGLGPFPDRPSYAATGGRSGLQNLPFQEPGVGAAFTARPYTFELPDIVNQAINAALQAAVPREIEIVPLKGEGAKFLSDLFKDAGSAVNEFKATLEVGQIRRSWGQFFDLFRQGSSDIQEASRASSELANEALVNQARAEILLNQRESNDALREAGDIGLTAIGGLSNLFASLTTNIDNATNALKNFLSQISQIAAQEFAKRLISFLGARLGGGQTFGGLTEGNIAAITADATGQQGLGIPGLQHGGLITEPVGLINRRGRIVGVAGEAGTEAVVPFKPGGSRSTGGGPSPTVIFNIQTADADSFSRSRAMLSDLAQRATGRRRGFGRGI